ncbi:hypothetical protein MNB_SUP05-SYMBIONT-4-1348 [hydrothermal vent metagenome]|uniref:Uncharacterized protein n=1 Tax=hydrothermal vent metagenome TaxID=652676 RepID=A0A1W1DZS6_9ZZZZ
MKEVLVTQTEKIMKHLRASGGIFGDSNIPNNANIYTSMSKALIPIGEYCDKYEINITELDSVKLLVFALPYIKENDSSMNSERYIFSIFKMLESAYSKTIDFNRQIDSSIKVCDKLFYNEKIEVVYAYIKGFQEALEYTNNQ